MAKNVRFEGQSDDQDAAMAASAKTNIQGKRMASFRTRTISTVVLISILLFILWAGHIPAGLLVMVCQAMAVRELFNIATEGGQEVKLPWFRAQQWYFFFITQYFMYLRFIKNNLLFELTHTHFLPVLFKTLVRRHTLISFCLYMTGFVAFVLSLKRGSYAYQFGQYGWTHMIIIVTIIPSSFYVASILEGMIWFLLPASLIIVNDISAYLFGFFFGRTPLISLSPKKTWEGFIGGFLSTMLVAFFLSGLMARFKWLTCPRQDFSFGTLDCETDNTYIFRRYTLEQVASDILPDALLPIGDQLLTQLLPAYHESIRSFSFYAMPLQLHAIVYAVFASAIAPFGGFFASGFKRAFKRKDFGNTIPGHGGIIDRFDCTIVMAIFSYLYHLTCISKSSVTVGDVLNAALKLTNDDQLDLFLHLGNLLIGEGLLPESIMEAAATHLANRSRAAFAQELYVM